MADPVARSSMSHQAILPTIARPPRWWSRRNYPPAYLHPSHTTCWSPRRRQGRSPTCPWGMSGHLPTSQVLNSCPGRSEEHTSELQSQSNLVCRLLLEKKKHTQPHAQVLDVQMGQM